MNYSDKIILALDSNKIDDNVSLIRELVPPISILKIGPISFLPNTNQLLNEIKRSNASVMFDFKFFDIPNTVTETLSFLFDINTKIFTIHCLSGPRTIRSIVNKINDLYSKTQDVDKGILRPEVFGVSILTSFDNEELQTVGLRGTIEDNVLRLVENSINAGIDGIVCSGHEIESIRNNFGNSVKILVPGVRLDSSEDDQKRIISPRDALNLGADYIVLGRTLTSYDDKKKRYDEILRTLD